MTICWSQRVVWSEQRVFCLAIVFKTGDKGRALLASEVVLARGRRVHCANRDLDVHSNLSHPYRALSHRGIVHLDKQCA